MRISVGDKVTIKKRSYAFDGNEGWVKRATSLKEELSVIKAIPMRGFLVRSVCGNSKVFNTSDLRKVKIGDL